MNVSDVESMLIMSCFCYLSATFIRCYLVIRWYDMNTLRSFSFNPLCLLVPLYLINICVVHHF